MDIRDALLEEHSKIQAQKIAHYIGNDPDRFAELIDLFLHDTSRITQRAAWVLSHCADTYPALIEPHVEKLWKNLQKPQNDAVKRNTLRIFQTYRFPKSLQGIAATLCFDYLLDPNEAVAVRAHAMTIAYNIALEEPELLPELALIIEEMLPHGTAGIKSRGNKILKAIRKQQRG